MPEEETRTLLVQEGSGSRFRLTIPATYKVTFGPGFVKKDRWGEHPQGYALRIYEAENKQRAVFTDVESFRDLSLPVEREVVTEEGSSSWTTDDGNHTSQRSVKRSRKFVADEAD